MRNNRLKEKNIKFFSLIVRNLHSVDDVYNYNLYMLAEVYLHFKNGVFSIDELIDVIREKLGKKSYGSKTNIDKHRKQLYKVLINAPLFFKYLGGKQFRIISNRKVLNSLGDSKYNTRYQYFPLIEKNNSKNFILNRKVFLNYCISTFLLCNKGYSNEQVAKHFNISLYRVQLATKANNEKRNEKERVPKKMRFAKVQYNDYEQAIEVRKKLWTLGICAKVFKEKGKFYVAVHRTNFYDDSNLPSHKFRVGSSAGKNNIIEKIVSPKKYIRESENFKFLNSNGKKTYNLPKERKDNTTHFFFNEKPTKRQKINNFTGWTLDNYIMEYGNLYN